jgi:hypothetical protein
VSLRLSSGSIARGLSPHDQQVSPLGHIAQAGIEGIIDVLSLDEHLDRLAVIPVDQPEKLHALSECEPGEDV